MEPLIRDFVDLVRIPSPSGNEREVMEYIISIVKKEDLGEVFFDNSKEKTGSNTNSLMICSTNFDPKKPAIILSAHADTVSVQSNITPILDDNIIKSDGKTILGADDKTGVAIILEILRNTKFMTNPPRIIALIFTFEESGLLGSKYFDYSLLPEVEYAGCLVFDGEKPEEIYMGYSSNWRYTIELTGKSAHAGMNPEDGISAILYAAHIIQTLNFSGLIGKVEFQNKTFTHNFPAMITGGDAWNKIPEKCLLSGEIRTFTPNLTKNFIKKITDVVNNITKDKVKVELIVSRSDEPVIIDSDNHFYLVVENAMKKTGLTPKKLSAMGRADSCNIYENTSLPTLCVGCGVREEHAVTEYAIVSEMKKTVEVAISLIESF